MNARIFIVSLLLTTTILTKAQSYHFSQFYTTPLLNNPAFTGYIDCPYRISANFRSQSLQGGSPYITGSLSADFSPLKERLAEGNKLGIGVSLLSDQSSGGALQTNSIGLSTAYNLSLDNEGIHHFGIGLQGVFHERRIDYTKLTFENQYTNGGFDPTIPISEAFNTRAKRYFDMNTGLLYNYVQENNSFFVGTGIYDVLQHKDNVQGVDEISKPVRFSLLGGGQVNVGYEGSVYFSINHMTQGFANMTTIGGAYGILIGSEGSQEIKFGLWHRIKDAIIPYVGYQFNSVHVGLSYDYTTSRAKSGSEIKNGIELSFVYRAKDNSEMKRLVPWY